MCQFRYDHNAERNPTVVHFPEDARCRQTGEYCTDPHDCEPNQCAGWEETEAICPACLDDSTQQHRLVLRGLVYRCRNCDQEYSAVDLSKALSESAAKWCAQCSKENDTWFELCKLREVVSTIKSSVTDIRW